MMLEVRDETGKLLFYCLNAENDWIQCPCGTLVPAGQMCTRCNRRTMGPSVENQTRKMLTGELNAKEQ